MARLNEPPPPAAESIDALKRRFLRQNREIARANSTQSVRIRNLECEVSRLVGENASLREQAIKLHYEAEKNAGKSVLESVDIVKAKLEAKLLELGGLVKDLGCVQQTAQDRRSQRRKSIKLSSPKRSPDQRLWKNTLSLSEAVGSADGRLPPIMEDKHYPRRTLSAEELLGLTSDPTNLTDSPDLGSPPVAHFEEGDPIKFDPARELSGPLENATEHEAPMLSANLETRKKRRESSHRRFQGAERTMTDVTKTGSPIGSGTDQPLKSSAKRKLNMRDESNPSSVTDDTGKEDIQENPMNTDLRRLESATSKPIMARTNRSTENKNGQSGPHNRQHRRERSLDDPAASTTNTRRALGPKSVNTDPMNSPFKASKGASKDKVADAKDELSRVVRERNRLKNKPPVKSIAQPKEKEGLSAISAVTDPEKPAQPLPETPAPPPNELFSPISTEPSAPRADSRDTPPPPDLGPDTGTGSFGRGSRRPRGAVNYAQPNLRDKMRRPTAELVDAVAAEERARQAMTAMTESEKSNLIKIKQEESTDDLPLWKTNIPSDGRDRNEPASPLSNKTGTSSNTLPSSSMAERRPRPAVPPRNEGGDKIIQSSSAAASTIAALTAAGNRSKAPKATKTGDENTQGQEPPERPSIYDFNGSSPNNGENAELPGSDDGRTKPSRSSRRHSSVPAVSDQVKGSLSISRRGERRRESVMEVKEDVSEGRDAVQPIARTRSVLDLDDGGGAAAMGRNERAASRRRSMML